MPSWLLPEGISDVLPDEARRIEERRRALLDLFRSYGYELVLPPLLEHLDSLLTGTGRDLDLSTFKLVDQLSGRSLGLRADTTPQVARIDAHILNRAGVVRLCYAGPVLHARPAHPLATREPIQVGAELYGDPTIDADAEIAELAVQALRRCGAGRVQFDLGHTAILRALLAADPAAASATDEILAALNAKDGAALGEALARTTATTAGAVDALSRLHGAGEAVIERARRELPAWPTVALALADLDRLVAGLARVGVEASVDLADQHGYRYHTGPTYAAYVPGLVGAALRGGRYDDIGQAFGRARPATGFSIVDLRELASLQAADEPAAIRFPRAADAALESLVASLRERGEIVVAENGVPSACGFRVDRQILRIGGSWQVVALSPGGGDPDA
ncbi:MAG TPA: ATP phosphoribosyltransferase regulatory subunit [Burkholderiaceae bacterium]|nr:ATP phosphoribosyltransferase regulatory subunit [Burkholderiaceae bacterium]